MMLLLPYFLLLLTLRKRKRELVEGRAVAGCRPTGARRTRMLASRCR